MISLDNILIPAIRLYAKLHIWPMSRQQGINSAISEFVAPQYLSPRQGIFPGKLFPSVDQKNDESIITILLLS